MAKLTGLFTLGRDAELRRTPGNDPVANLALAYNFGKKDPAGKRPTQWIDASLWGERAEKLAEYLTKGSQFLFVVDDLHVATYAKNDGTQGVKLVGRVVDLEFTRGGSQDRAPAAPAARTNQRAPAPAPRPSSGFDDFESDVPF